MNNLELISLLLGQLGTIAQDPALGYRGAAITQALALISQLVLKGEAARAELEALGAQVQAMVATGREPTKDEWDSLRAIAKKHHDVLNPPPPEAVAAETTA